MCSSNLFNFTTISFPRHFCLSSIQINVSCLTKSNTVLSGHYHSSKSQQIMQGNQTEPPLVVHIEGSVKVGITTIMEELSQIQPPGCQVHYMHAIERHPLQTVIGDINWTAWRESHKGMGACLIELTNYLMQRYKKQIPLGTQMVVMNRSLRSLH